MEMTVTTVLMIDTLMTRPSLIPMTVVCVTILPGSSSLERRSSGGVVGVMDVATTWPAAELSRGATNGGRYLK